MSRSGRPRDGGVFLRRGGDVVHVETPEGVRHYLAEGYVSATRAEEVSPLLLKLQVGPDSMQVADFDRRREELLPADPFSLLETEEGLDRLAALDALVKCIEGYRESWNTDDEVEAAFVEVERTGAVLATAGKERRAA